MHAPIPTIFSLFFYHFLSFNPFLFYFQFLTLLSWVVPHLVFSFLGSLSLSAYYFLTMSFSPQVPSPPWVPFFRCFSLFLVFPPPFGPLFLPWLPSLYSELIQWDFSLLPLGLHQLFLVCCGHPFNITHPPIGCPCHCFVHVCCTATHFTTKFSFVCSCCIPLPHYLALWHASDSPNHLLLLLGKISSQQDIFPKEVIAGNQIQTPFSPHHQTTSSESP